MSNISPIIKYFVEQGVPLGTVILLLMFPLIATLVAAFRQVIGIKAFGIYTPSIIIFAILATGIKYGLALFVIVLLVGMGTRLLLKKLRILYLPRVAITLSIVSISILLLLVVGGYFQRTGLAAVSIFPLLIMITLVEKFVAAQIEKGSKVAVVLTIEPLIISLVGYYLVKWPLMINLIVSYPWVVLFTIPINVALGKWSGLRLSEYLRFKEIFKRM